MKPKINVWYYKNILDRCLLRFFDEHNSDFSRTEGGDYVLSSGATESTLVKTFTSYVKDELGKYVEKFRDSSPEMYFIIGSCCPCDNMLLDIVDRGRMGRLARAVEQFPDIRYVLKESDIKLDTMMFNSVFESIFLKFMKERRKTWPNVFFIRHRRVDCYMMYKFFKKRFGSMVVNLNKKHGMGKDMAIFSINEKIDKNCHDKAELVNSGTFAVVEEEVYQYIDMCINGDF